MTGSLSTDDVFFHELLQRAGVPQVSIQRIWSQKVISKINLAGQSTEVQRIATLLQAQGFNGLELNEISHSLHKHMTYLQRLSSAEIEKIRSAMQQALQPQLEKEKTSKWERFWSKVRGLGKGRGNLVSEGEWGKKVYDTLEKVQLVAQKIEDHTTQLDLLNQYFSNLQLPPPPDVPKNSQEIAAWDAQEQTWKTDIANRINTYTANLLTEFNSLVTQEKENPLLAGDLAKEELDPLVAKQKEIISTFETYCNYLSQSPTSSQTNTSTLHAFLAKQHNSSMRTLLNKLKLSLTENQEPNPPTSTQPSLIPYPPATPPQTTPLQPPTITEAPQQKITFTQFRETRITELETEYNDIPLPSKPLFQQISLSEIRMIQDCKRKLCDNLSQSLISLSAEEKTTFYNLLKGKQFKTNSLVQAFLLFYPPQK